MIKITSQLCIHIQFFFLSFAWSYRITHVAVKDKKISNLINEMSKAYATFIITEGLSRILKILPTMHTTNFRWLLIRLSCTFNTHVSVRYCVRYAAKPYLDATIIKF